MLRTHRYLFHAIISFAALCATSSAASAHAGETFDDWQWNVWSFEPAVVIPTALVALAYATGVVRRRAIKTSWQLWQHAAFAGGLAGVYLALESPADYVAEHLFLAHQIQHMLLRVIGPAFIALSAPQAMLVAGLPAALRRGALTPLAGNGTLGRLFGWLTSPVIVTILFIAALYVSAIPAVSRRRAARRPHPRHHARHHADRRASVLVADLRPAAGAGRAFLRVRLMMLWISILSNIGLGAYTTLKGDVLYPAYDIVGRLFDIAPLTDEMVGGFIIWVPSSMMAVIAVLIVVHMWGRQETRADTLRETSPGARRALSDHRRGAGGERAGRSNVLAIGVAAFMAAVFAMAIFAGVLSHLNSTHHGLLAHSLSAAPTVIR